MFESIYSEQEIPAVLSVAELGQILGIGTNKAYQLVHSNQLETLRIGKQIRIPRHSLLKYLGAFED